MDDDFSLEALLEQLDEEEDAEVLNGWATSLYKKMIQCHDAAKLAALTEDISGYQYWFDQSRQYKAIFWQVRERLRHLRDRTTLELQWLIDSMPPELSEN
jgi:hypothetical protein